MSNAVNIQLSVSGVDNLAKSMQLLAEAITNHPNIKISIDTLTNAEAGAEADAAPILPGAVPVDSTEAEAVFAKADAETSAAYTFEDLARAAAAVMDQGPEFIPKLQAINAEMGVESLADLPKDKYGDFAEKLKGLGAKL